MGRIYHSLRDAHPLKLYSSGFTGGYFWDEERSPGVDSTQDTVTGWYLMSVTGVH